MLKNSLYYDVCQFQYAQLIDTQIGSEKTDRESKRERMRAQENERAREREIDREVVRCDKEIANQINRQRKNENVFV